MKNIIIKTVTNCEKLLIENKSNECILSLINYSNKSIYYKSFQSKLNNTYSTKQQ